MTPPRFCYLYQSKIIQKQPNTATRYAARLSSWGQVRARVQCARCARTSTHAQYLFFKMS